MEFQELDKNAPVELRTLDDISFTSVAFSLTQLDAVFQALLIHAPVSFAALLTQLVNLDQRLCVLLLVVAPVAEVSILLRFVWDVPTFPVASAPACEANPPATAAPTAIAPAVAPALESLKLSIISSGLIPLSIKEFSTSSILLL